MKVILDHGDRLILSGPPGGRGAVILVLVVGTVMAIGGGLFFRAGLIHHEWSIIILGGLVGLVGSAAFLLGFGMAITRDRLELDQVTKEGLWTRKLCGRSIAAPIEFDLKFAKHVTVEHFTETSPGHDGRGSSSVRKVRGCLLISKPRRRIILDEAERSRTPRVQAVAQAVASLLDLEVEIKEDPSDA